jgi:hypothetical protein
MRRSASAKVVRPQAGIAGLMGSASETGVLSTFSFLLPRVCCLLPAICCLLPSACCLLSAVCCLLSAVFCLLSAVCCLLSAVCCLLSAVCCLLSAVYYLLSAVCCLLSAVCCLLACSIGASETGTSACIIPCLISCLCRRYDRLHAATPFPLVSQDWNRATGIGKSRELTLAYSNQPRVSVPFRSCFNSLASEFKRRARSKIVEELKRLVTINTCTRCELNCL